MKKMLKISLVLTLFALTAQAQVTSVLWGVSGEAWSTNGLLRDFTANAGYMGGNVPIPDWPVWTNLTDMGAVVDDRGSDVAALRAAISNCPPYHAIFLPNGTYMIDEQIAVSSDNIVIRGESRDGTILYFPKHMNEITETVTILDPFILFEGGTNRGIENVSLVLRDERKGVGYFNRNLDKENDPHWWYNGEVPIKFGNYEKNSWMRNIYVKNGNHPIRVNKAYNITVLNVVLDDFVGREDPDQSSVVGHMGVYLGDGAHNCLVHNIRITGDYVHDLCPMGITDSVFSRISGPGVRLDHHAGGNVRNLYTEIDYGFWDGYGTIGNVGPEVYWNLNGITDAEYLPTDRSCVLVGIKTSEPTSIGDTWHHETLDPNALTPANLYLAQMAYHNKTNTPADMELTLPEIGPGVPGQIRVIADTSVGESGTVRPYEDLAVYSGPNSEDVASYLKFDLSQVSATSVSNVILRTYCGSGISVPVTLQEVSDDSWTEAGMTWSNRPQAGDSIQTNSSGSGWVDWDITATVNRELAASDYTLSLCLQDLSGSGTQEWFESKETPAYVPHLVVGVDKIRPAPPTAPTGLGAALDGTKIILDWADNPETHYLTYNVYRNRNGEGYKIDAMGLRWSDYENSALEDGSRYYYRVSAVDAWGQESAQSDVIAATIGGEVSNLPLFTTHPIIESNAKQGVPYTATLADNALNPEPYEMTFSLLSAPTWLNVASNGTLTGTPTAGDVGTNTFTVAVEAENGGDTNTLQITVLSISVTNLFINDSGDGLFEDGVNWSTGLPSVSNNVGYIDVNCKYSITDRNTYYIIHRAGAIYSSGIGSDPKLVGGTFAQNGGTFGSAGDRGFDMDSGNITTLNGGAIYSGSKGNADINGGSTLIINGGTFEQFGGRNISINSSTLTMNGGTLASALSIVSSSSLLNFNGGAATATALGLDANSTARFGGTSAGSVTVATLTAGTVDWLSGTKMSLTVTNTADWAQALWDADTLTYNGQSKTDLGLDWAAVTTTGLGDGSIFAYNSGTKTLTLLSDPSSVPPAAPAGLSATAANAIVTLDWTDGGADVATYSVYRSLAAESGYAAIESNLNVSAYEDTAVVNDTTYYYKVTAVGTNDLESLKSEYVTATPFVPDTTPPAAPAGLAATAADGSVSLSWNTNSEPDLASYSVYRSTTSGSYGAALVSSLNAAGYVDSNVTNGQTYYYAIAAVDTSSNESVKSTENSATPAADGSTSLATDPGFDADFTDVGGDTFTQNDSDKFDKWVCFIDAKRWIRRSADGNPDGYADGAFSGNNYNRTLLQGITDNKTTTGMVDLTFDLKLIDGGVGNGPLTVSIWGVETLSGASFSLSARLQAGVTAGDATILRTQQFSTDTTGWEEQTISNIDLGTGYDLIVIGFWSAEYAAGVGDFVGIDNVALGGGALTGYDLWATEWNTEIGAATNDLDADGLSNFGEYAMGGNPTNALDCGAGSVLSKVRTGFIYVHPQRSDDATITYTVETTTNLISGVWTNQGVVAIGTNVTGGTLDFVTNEVGALEKDKFFRLKIEQ